MRLDAGDRRLLIESGVALTAIKLGLWLLPFRVLRRLLAKVAVRTTRTSRYEPKVVKKVIWAVNLTGAHIPLFRNCLNRALAAQALLNRRGQPVTLRIGVGRGEEGEFRAHAWIESEGRVVLGRLDDLHLYTPLPPLEGKPL